MAIEAFFRLKRVCLLEAQEILSKGLLDDKQIYEMNMARVLIEDAVMFHKRYNELKSEMEKRQIEKAGSQKE